MVIAEFFVPGKPAPGGSKKGFYIKKIKRVIMTPDNKKTKPWMDSVKCFALQAYSGPPLEEPIELEITFQFLRPKSHFGTGRNAGKLKLSTKKYPTVRPDLTKLTRSTEDALTGLIWRDDSQVVRQMTKKIYTEKQGAFIVIRPIENKSETLF